MVQFQFQSAAALLLLASSATQQASAACSSSCPNPTIHSNVFDVAIMGAGMAGVKAAETFSQYPGVNYVVFEAEDRIGGRMKKGSVGGYTIEYGANWIQGGSRNPIYELADQYDVAYDLQAFKDWDAYLEEEDGTVTPIRGNEVSKEQNNLRKALELCLAKEADEYYVSGEVNDTDPTLDPGAQAVLRDTCDWDPQTPLQREVDWYGFNYAYTFNTEDISLASFPEDTYRDFNSQNLLVFDQDGGYEDIAARLANDNELNIELDTTVDCIDWELNEPEFYTHQTSDPSQCAVYKTKKGISTGSVDVLVENTDLFHPTLESSKNMSENVFDMGLYYKVFYNFSTNFWSAHGDYEFINIAREDPSKRALCNHWQNLDLPYFLPGSNILFCTITTEQLDQIGTEDFDIPQYWLDEFVKPLFAAFDVDESQISYESDYYNWHTDEWTYGSYANWKVGGKVPEFYSFFSPLQYNRVNKVHFSGSATCFRYWELVQGAYFAGLRTANIVLDELGYNADTESICDQLL